MNLAAERTESLKAGVVGATSAAIVFFLITVLHLAIFYSSQTIGLNLAMLAKGGITLLSGFLFGVTYRYIIRQDTNSHLKSGAVMAFGLVRGLAQVEMELNQGISSLDRVQLWQLSLLVPENIGLFAGTVLLLDWAMGQGWIKAMD